MAIKVIVELQAKPGRLAELRSVLERMIANEGPSQHGFLGSTRYGVPIRAVVRSACRSGPGHGHQPPLVTELDVATPAINNDAMFDASLRWVPWGHEPHLKRTCRDL